MSEPTDIDALIEASRTWVPAECAASPVGAWHIIERLGDALESVYSDSLTGQAEHARWQERAERAESALARVSGYASAAVERIRGGVDQEGAADV